MNQQLPSQDTEDNEDSGMVSFGVMKFADSKIPEFKKIVGKEYVAFGEDNLYPNYLIELYNKSSIHNAIINGKCVYILGNGLCSVDPAGEKFLENANEKQSWKQLSRMICVDIENFGGFYLEVIPKLAGGYNYYHTSFDKIRTNIDRSKYFYAEEWKKNWSKSEKEFPPFYPGIKESSIFSYKEYRCGKAPYALPSWLPACNWIESNIEVSKATLTNAKNGFSASKLVSFFNGEPEEKKKKGIERRFENAATGAEGKKILLTFNNTTTQKPTVEDLGASDLTKENFTPINDLITSNIFAAHSVTHPLLFGIQQAGKLGSSQELRVAYDIFKNTYSNNKQRNLEDLIKFFASIAGINCEFVIKDVEPIGLEFTETAILAVAPKSWILEKMGIDITKYNEAPDPSVGLSASNSTLTNLTGRQHQQISRIVRQYGQGKLNKAQSSLMLKNGFGFTDEDVNNYLGEDQQFSSEEDENSIALMFSEYGDERDNYTIVKSEVFDGVDKFEFKETLEDDQKKILDLIKDEPNLTPEEIAARLTIDTIVVEGVLNELKKTGIINRIGRIIGLPTKKTLPDLQVMYSYEKRPEVSGSTILPSSRAFCKKMVQLSETKMFSRKDIQSISERLGYSVFTRAGGFWNNNGTIEFHCRHAWIKHIVTTKK